MRPVPTSVVAHPHVALLQGVAASLAWCLATPLALWLACSVLAPLLGTLAGHPELVREQLGTVAASEAAQAQLVTPALDSPLWGAAEAGWPWRRSAAWWQRWLPDQAEAPPPARRSGSARPTLVTMLGRVARPWHADRTVQRLLASIACTRACYALAALLGLLPFLAMCHGLAIPSSPPRARRARWWLLCLRHAMAGGAAVCALPLVIATLPLLLAVVVLAGGALAMLRRHTPGW